MSDSIQKFFDFTAQWWKLTNAEKPPSHPKERKLVAIKDLPLYPDPSTKPTYLVERDPLPGQHVFKSAREFIQFYSDTLKENFGFVGTAKDTAVNTYTAVDNYVQREGAVIPRTIFITLGGMAGFYWGMRYYGLRKFLYAGIGLTTVAAFCYPQEAMIIARTSVEHAKRTYDDFKKAPEPANKNK